MRPISGVRQPSSRVPQRMKKQEGAYPHPADVAEMTMAKEKVTPNKGRRAVLPCRLPPLPPRARRCDHHRLRRCDGALHGVLPVHAYFLSLSGFSLRQYGEKIAKKQDRIRKNTKNTIEKTQKIL